MNTRSPLEAPSMTEVLSISFNNDASCFSVGLNSGFCIFHADPCSLKTTRDFNAGIGLAQMMGRSNFIALVGGGKQPRFAQNKVIKAQPKATSQASIIFTRRLPFTPPLTPKCPNQVLIWDESTGRVAAEIATLSVIRGVRLTKDRVVLVLQNCVQAYSFAKRPELLAKYETADSQAGICSMSDRHLAFPGRTPGQVQLVEHSTGNVSIIPAHASALRAVELSRDGEILATASETGTLIRIFATNNCARLAELRRGIDPASIFSLAFSPSGTKLACTSDKSTLHIFDVPHPKRPARPTRPTLPIGGPQAGEADNSKWGFLSRLPLMPRVFSDVYSFASAQFQGNDDSSLAGLPITESTAAQGPTQPKKGIIGWVREDALLVIGAGKDARWERFAIREGFDGRRYCIREGWKRYLGNA